MPRIPQYVPLILILCILPGVDTFLAGVVSFVVSLFVRGLKLLPKDSQKAPCFS